MKERHVVRRAPIPSIFAIASILLVFLVLGGIGQATADGNDLFEGRHYELGTPPETFTPPATVGAATVFGEDDRVEVEDTTEWPYRTVTHLVVFDIFDEYVQECSGILLNVDVVLTAAHCLWDDERDAPYGSILVIPGEDGIGTEPFGIAGAPGDWISFPRGYTESSGPEFDFGLVHLAAWDYGPEIGPFPLLASASGDFFDHPETALFTAGYPGDKPTGTQWWSAAPVDFVDEQLIYTLMDAYPGQSGSGIFALNFQSEDLAVVGVYSTESAFSNQAVRLSPLHIDALHNYCEEAGCSFSSTHLEAPAAPTPTLTPTSTPTRTPTPQPTSPPEPSTLPIQGRLAHISRD